ncbi:RNA 2'-phosphotransferase [Bacillus pseudomycoides]|uniref:RNA 2'-phosphotransferase n=1 Tax=Bacillus pseudomycoides TaxID=64104 RepID=UPI000BEBC3BD|nr:RNA 2'-phosphotransferase [Bacillus pseudomycoides]PEE40772.1 RNA 2'-phosphotransferase [Bacillus pseudomycoides]PGA87680.1 RNA 2'-phosphotransferase [Bacillus pseudomycoides]PHF38408.1 RNA 2'-phosphotransferase [Bacillus pseudomycoides]
MNKEKFYINLSKEVSYALRHAPWEYELELDENGWVSVAQLLQALHQSVEWKDVEIDDLKMMIEKSEKKRHEIKEDKIRALYGHSISTKIVKKEAAPPKFLYHGTSPYFLNSIELNGLSPMSRQYVHLSEDVETAELVGKRKDKYPVILVVNTEKAREKGIKFYLGNEKVWLADSISSEFIEILKD